MSGVVEGLSTHGALRARGLVWALAIAVAAIVLLPATAYATAVVTPTAPTEGQLLTGQPGNITVYVDDASQILMNSTITLDGVVQSTNVEWLGHWDDPTCMENWIVDDDTAAYMSVYMGSQFLNEGVHSVSVTVNTATSGTTTYSYTFTIDFPAGSQATFSALTPTAGSTVTGSTYLRATVSAPTIIYSSNCMFYLNGVALAPIAFNGATSFTMSTYPQTPRDATNTVIIRVRDANGVVSETSWTFNGSIAPTILAPYTPANGAVVSVPRPTIGASVSDNTPGPLGVRIVVDGVERFNALASQGFVGWTPTADYANGTTHSVSMTVTDSIGLQRTASWAFQIVAPAPMSGTDCLTCHTTYPQTHTMTNCTACHGYGTYHGEGAAPTPAGACLGCHDWDHGYSYLVGRECTWCHTAAYPTVPEHVTATVNAKHASSTTGCTQCHSNDLPTEHGKYPSGTAWKYQCGICHASANPAVQSALANHDTSCSACHAISGHESQHADGAPVAGSECAQCHSANVVTEHLGRGLTCGTCHDAGTSVAGSSAMVLSALGAAEPSQSWFDPASGGSSVAFTGMTPGDVTAAIAAGDTSCDACHPYFHGSMVSSGLSNPDYPQYVWWPEAQDLASANPDAALMAQGPHAGYATTTVKCAVCHSVHRGSTTLLNQGSSCAYCHSDASWGGGAVAGALISWGTNTNAPGQTTSGPHAACSSDFCHASPHGVGASAYTGPASRLLTGAADAELNEIATANGVATTEFGSYSATTRALATAAVCGRQGCHENSVFGVVTAGASTTVSGMAAPVTGHRVIASATTDWNASGSFDTAVTGTIAYAPVSYCTSCHDLVDDNNSGKPAFPHAIDGVVDAAAAADGSSRPAAWLTAGAFAGGARFAVGPYDQATGDGTTVAGSAGSSVLDGTCLKCHRGSASSGLGFGY